MIVDGTQLGPYRVGGPLGSGGMGEVYRAVDTRLGREVAIKILPEAFAENPLRMQRFQQEARAAGMLNHPNLLTIFDVGVDPHAPYLVFELLEGETLRERMRGGKLPQRKALEFALQVAHGLASAHQKGIIHRDLKPDNLFITRDDRVKILDFGLAKVTELVTQEETTAAIPDTPATNPGTIIGTASYMSPEQVRGEKVDHRSDIFSLGSILYEMLSGERAFTREFPIETMNAIARDDPPDLMRLDPSISPAVARVVRHCLEKSPEARFQSARDLAFQIESLLDMTSGVSSPAFLVPEKKRSAKRLAIHGALLLAGCFLGVLIAASMGERFATADPPVVRYLSDSGTDHAPDASPDGQTIAFASARDGVSRIWLKQLRSGNEISLTSGPDDSPRFSTDGTTLLFTRTGPNGPSLYRVATVGGEARKILDGGEEGDWAPDGQHIVFIRFARRGAQPLSQIWTVSSDGSGAKQIYETSEAILSWPRWSPDGKRIAVTAGGRQTPGSILVVTADGKDPQRLSPGGSVGVLTAAAWVGAEKIVYGYSDAVTAARGAAGALVVQDVDGGKPVKIVGLPRTGFVLDVAGKGKLVVDVNSSYQNLREWKLSGTTAADPPRWLTRGTTTDRQPMYDSSGEWILFSSNRNANLDLWRVSTRTGALQRLTDHSADDWDPAYSADGKKLIWSSNRGGHFEIWTADADGGNARQVSSDGTDAENGTTPRDGQWIVYTSLSPLKRGLWKVRPDGSQATQVVKGPALQPEVSPDGQHVVYHYTVPQKGVAVVVVRLADGTPTSFRSLLAQGISAGRARWLPDGKAIAFVGRDELGRNGVFVQDFDPLHDTSSTRRKLAGFDAELPAESFGISPDGTRLTISVVQQLSGIMTVEGVRQIE